PEAVKKRIIDACDPVVGHAGSPLFHGRVNAKNALTASVNATLAVQNFDVGGTANGSFGPINSENTLNVNFINLSPTGTSLTAQVQPGNGYSWDNFDPLHSAGWPNATLGNI